MSKKPHTPAQTPTPDTNPSTTPPVDAEKPRAELEAEVETLKQLVADTEARYKLHLAECRTRIVELELAAATRQVPAAPTNNGELREAAQRLRASTLPESDAVAEAIRLLVDHHDPQDGDESEDA